MKSSKAALLGLCALLAASCGKPSAKIEGTLTGAAGKDVTVKLLDVNTYTVLDTVRTDAAGNFSYKVSIAENDPEFIYLFYGENKVSSLLLKAGDNVKVVVDTLGNGTVEGSEESLKLQEVERNFAEFTKKSAAAASSAEYTKEYIQYYRDVVKYVITNPHSLTVIPVLFQNITPEFPVFSQNTDAIHFRNALDSLKADYPDSKYVKALETETLRREQILGLDAQIMTAKQLGYPDIKSRDINGNEVNLSAIDAKAIIVYFWTVTDNGSKILNQDTFKPLYEDYHSKGLEIFAVSLDTDKAAWATVVKNQDLPWINVNDGNGINSLAAATYNISALPQYFLIINGDILDRAVVGENALRRELDKAL